MHRLSDSDTLHLDRFGQSAELMVNRFETIERGVDCESPMIACNFVDAHCKQIEKSPNTQISKFHIFIIDNSNSNSTTYWYVGMLADDSSTFMFI